MVAGSNPVGVTNSTDKLSGYGSSPVGVTNLSYTKVKYFDERSNSKIVFPIFYLKLLGKS